MTISIPNRNDKVRSRLIDAFRILAWQEYKMENKESALKGLELYQKEFQPEWDKHEIHKMSLTELNKFCKEYGYSEQDLISVRGEFYRNRNQFKAQNEENLDSANMPF